MLEDFDTKDRKVKGSGEILEAFRLLGFDVEVATQDKPNAFLIICKREDLDRLVDKLEAVRTIVSKPLKNEGTESQAPTGR